MARDLSFHELSFDFDFQTPLYLHLETGDPMKHGDATTNPNQIVRLRYEHYHCCTEREGDIVEFAPQCVQGAYMRPSVVCIARGAELRLHSTSTDGGPWVEL